MLESLFFAIAAAYSGAVAWLAWSVAAVILTDEFLRERPDD